MMQVEEEGKGVYVERHRKQGEKFKMTMLLFETIATSSDHSMTAEV